MLVYECMFRDRDLILDEQFDALRGVLGNYLVR